ncbi:MAG: hypothetical protein WC582_03735 [Patescibacteria group bacterium]
MEKTFKFVFVLGVIVFCLVVIGIFLLALKIMLIFSPQINILGLTIT